MTSTLCAIVKNEERYVLEWVAFHRLIGFDNIVIYENDSSDGTPGLLASLCDRKIIDQHITWSNVNGSPQIGAYTDALCKCQTDWIMFLDADEFLNIHSHQPVDAFLTRFGPETSCVAVNWRVFGSNGLKEYANALVIERFTRASTPSASVNRHVKCFVRPECVEAAHIHAPLMRSGACVIANGAPLDMTPRGLTISASHEPAQINHYFTKSNEEYSNKKRRGNANRHNDDPDKFIRYTDDMFQMHDLNDEYEDSITWAVLKIRAWCDANFKPLSFV